MQPDEASLSEDTANLREQAIGRATSLLGQLEAERADLLRSQQFQHSVDIQRGMQRGVEAMSKVITAARLVRERLQGG